MNPALAIQPPEVVIEAGVDARLVEAALALTQAWSAEQGAELDVQAWAEQMQSRCGRMCLGIAWDGGTPVGMAEIDMAYEPETGLEVAWAERTYVLPEYRKLGVTKQLAEGFDVFCLMSGIRYGRTMVLTDKTGQFMQKFHEGNGFHPRAVVLEREYV